MSTTILTILPQGLTVDIEEGETILSAVRRSGQHIGLDAPCNGKHTCGKCRVFIKKGSVSPPEAMELSFLTAGDIDDGIRLACLTRASSPLTPITVELATVKEMHGILEHGFMPSFTFHPLAVRKSFCFELPEAECGNTLSGSLSTLFHHIAGTPLPPNDVCLLGQLARLEADQQVDAIYFDGAPIALTPLRERSRVCGIAVDIGTTTVACSLLDLETGEHLARASSLNPQSSYGADVLSRIEYTMRDPGGIQVLQSLIAGCLDRLTLELLGQCGLSPDDVYCYSVAGNTTMLHLLIGVAPRSIALAPYRPVFTEAQVLPAQRLGLHHCAAGAVLCCLPSISGYIGADILAGIEISGIASTDDNVLFIDIGTNGEIVLSRHGVLSSCSCAAGPALEGMNISCGMRAADGAIEKVCFHHDCFEIETIGALPPAGLCGSGVLDATSTLLKAGIIDRSGRIADPLPAAVRKHAVANGRSFSFVLSDGIKPVYFSQADIRQVQLAKGAILSGIMALLGSAGLTPDDVDRVLIAGQFGAHLAEDSLLGTGLLPYAFQSKVTYIGNTSLTGAELFMLDRAAGARMARLSGSVSYLELATYPNYTRLLMDSMKFPLNPQ